MKGQLGLSGFVTPTEYEDKVGNGLVDEVGVGSASAASGAEVEVTGAAAARPSCGRRSRPAGGTSVTMHPADIALHWPSSLPCRAKSIRSTRTSTFSLSPHPPSTMELQAHHFTFHSSQNKRLKLLNRQVR